MKIEATPYHYGSGFTVTEPQEQKNRKPLGYSQYSGTVCQQSGQWSTELHAVRQVVSVEKGKVMPYHSGQAVTWQLDDYSVSENLIKPHAAL
ncbi:hypothetical protein GJV04_06395 [Enterobacteriaceae bacterium RIT714]|nr:hypothetical protein [Enterobacteriaceae bacterium RIT714]